MQKKTVDVKNHKKTFKGGSLMGPPQRANYICGIG